MRQDLLPCGPIMKEKQEGWPLTVYADVLVITNLYVDFFLLWCTRRTLQLRGKGWRMALGALVGGLSSLVCLIPRQPWWITLAWGGVAGAGAAAVAFCPLSLRGLIKAVLCFWGYSLVLAGFFVFLIQWFAPGNLALVGHSLYLDLSPGLLFLFTGGAYLVFWSFQRLFHREDVSQKLCRIQVRQGEKSVTLWAKADTGCTLREPFSGLPVIVCQASALKPLLPPGLEEALGKGDTLPDFPLRMVPFDSLGGTGVLPAFRPEEVRPLPNGPTLPCYIALWQREFPAGGFQALYGPGQFPQMEQNDPGHSQ